MPIGDTKTISNQVFNAFQYVGQIASIKPLMFENTTVCSDQWLVAFETTKNPDLLSKIPRSTHIGNYKITKAKELRERNRTQSLLALETNFSQDNPYVKVLQEKEQTDKTTDTKDTTL
ncbi:8434_t:CDS:2 [Cetraspora pellucida]|uniref:8434_t:CDS:1 n=1 Tax=Cetraspora pellucida TaxID=1433469 RepID=A0ACA9NS39_9GLOM|nr:8434_t:CDS:2 [Cetraspora pellucida]